MHLPPESDPTNVVHIYHTSFVECLALGDSVPFRSGLEYLRNVAYNSVELPYPRIVKYSW